MKCIAKVTTHESKASGLNINTETGGRRQSKGKQLSPVTLPSALPQGGPQACHCNFDSDFKVEGLILIHNLAGVLEANQKNPFFTGRK